MHGFAAGAIMHGFAAGAIRHGFAAGAIMHAFAAGATMETRCGTETKRLVKSRSGQGFHRFEQRTDETGGPCTEQPDEWHERGTQ